MKSRRRGRGSAPASPRELFWLTAVLVLDAVFLVGLATWTYLHPGPQLPPIPHDHHHVLP